MKTPNAIEKLQMKIFEWKHRSYTSKSKLGECKNISCTNPRRDKSAYCQKCSDKYQKVMLQK